MAAEVWRKIAGEVAGSPFYTVIIDECKDVSKAEQLNFCVRYEEDSKPREQFLGFVHLEMEFGARAITDQVLAFTEMMEGFGCLLVALSADGANVMVGDIAGVQRMLKERYPLITYVHCLCHRLNLVIVKSLKSVCPVLLRNMDKLHSVFGAAKTNDVFRDVQKGSDISVRSVPARCDTRWSSMFMVLDVVCNRYKEVLITLATRESDTDAAADSCAGLYAKLCSGTMIITCVVFGKALGYTKTLSDYLPGEC